MPFWFYSDGGPRVVTITFQANTAVTSSASSHTFTAMAVGTTGIVIVGLGWQSASPTTLTSLTVGGVTASTLVGVVSAAGGGREMSLQIASGIAGTTADVVITLSGTALNFAAETNSMLGANLSPAQTASSIASAPTAVMTCLAGGAIIGAAIGGAGSAPTATATGIVLDSSFNFGSGNLQCFGAAHANFTVAQAALTTTITFSPIVTAAGAFASFNPS